MNLLHSIKGLLIVFITLLFCSCGWLLKDHRFDYLNEKQEETAKKVLTKYNNKYNGKITTKISPIKNYCKAEEYHQKYLEKNF